MYVIKDRLINGYRDLVKCIDDVDILLADYQKDYQADIIMVKI